MSEKIFFSRLLEGSCSSAVSVFKNVGERSAAKNYRPVRLLHADSKIFENLVNDRLAVHLESLFSDSQYGFRSSQ